MFRITNIQTRQQETCSTRDDLLSLINEKSVWVADRQETVTLQLDQLAEDGSLLDNQTLTLPLETIVEDALSGFGLKREKRGFSILRNKPLKDVSKEEPMSKSKQEAVEPISAPQPETKVPKEVIQKPEEVVQPISPEPQQPSKTTKKKIRPTGLIWKLLTIVGLGLSFGSLAFIQVQTKTIKTLENRISLEEEQGRVEVVGRFFIANYYSGINDNIKDYLSKDLKAEGVDSRTDEQVQATFYESMSFSKGIVKVTFVVSTRKEEDIVNTVRLTLAFQKDDQAKYGYVLVEQPKFSSFAE